MPFQQFPAFREQITGIEPASPAWEAGVLPMNYICACHYYSTTYFFVQDGSAGLRKIFFVIYCNRQQL